MKSIGFPLLAILLFLTAESALALEVPLKDLARVQGSRRHRLMGYGLVTGLNGTGDKSPVTIKMARNLFKNMGLQDLSEKDVQSNNCAAVVVTAEVDNFIRLGDNFDLTVSSVGNAKSLKGGILLATLLKGGNGNVYAQAQGPVVLGASANAQGGNAKTHETLGAVPSGGILEVDFPYDFQKDPGFLALVLKRPDFTTASRVVKTINTHFDLPDLATAPDSGMIRVVVPKVYQSRLVDFISQLENLSVAPSDSARVVINEKTGTVVFGADVRIAPTVLSHGELQIKIGTEQDPKKTGKVISLDGAGTIQSLVQSLNAIGVGPHDLIAILQALKVQGALKAELVTF